MAASTAQTVGAFEVGIVLTALSNGVLALQMSQYFRKPRNDLLSKKLFVLFIWLATVVHLFLSVSSFHTAVITNYDNLTLEMTLGPAFLSIASVESVVHSSVQSIYTYRLYKLTGHWVFPAVCLILSTYVLGSGIAYTGNIEAELLVPTTRWQWLVYSHFSVTAGTDILIAVSTCWYLVQRRDTGLKSTRRLVNRIVLRIVQTGIATSVVALCVLILDSASHSTSAWLSVYLPLTPLYSMTLLALLNGRVPLPAEESSTIRTIETPGILESRVRTGIRFDNSTGTNLSLMERE